MALQTLVWTDPAHARELLLEQPATCLDPAFPGDAVAAGQALFNAPGLLGGQARRAGLSCAGCHTNGRRNAWFRLEGISGDPGTADVSASFFSLARANGRFDPRPIPDLAMPGKVSRDPATGALEAFARGLVVEEFAGAEPGKPSLAALASYVRAVRACPGPASVRHTIVSDLALVRASTMGARYFMDRGDAAAAGVLVGAARFRLGLISERMAGPALMLLRARLLAQSNALGQIESGLPESIARLAGWQRAFDRSLTPALLRAEAHSLYSPAQVDRLLAH